jgi:erythromycin esterase-like protein
MWVESVTWFGGFDEVSPTMIKAINAAAREIPVEAASYPGLIQKLRNARLVLLGEASHGTHEFYRIRAVLTRELDWPDAYRVNRWVRGTGGDTTAEQALLAVLARRECVRICHLCRATTA